MSKPDKQDKKKKTISVDLRNMKNVGLSILEYDT